MERINLVMTMLGLALSTTLGCAVAKNAATESSVGCEAELTVAVDSIMKGAIDEEGRSRSTTIGAAVGIIGLATPSGNWTRGYGLTEKLGKEVPSAETLFEVGSNTKPITAVLIMELVQEGKLHLNDPVGLYMPSGTTAPSYRGKEPTIQHLLNHTSGFPRSPKQFKAVEARTNPMTADALFSALDGYKLPYAPGTEYSYSNVGFGFLTAVLEKLEKKPYADIVGERVFAPLKMTRSFVSVSSERQPGTAQGYSYRGFWKPGPASSPTDAINSGINQGAGAIVSSVNEMLGWIGANLHPPATHLGEAIKQTQIPTFKLNPDHSVGSGWELKKEKERTFVEHGGLTAGFSSEVALQMELGMGIVLLTNHGKNGFGKTKDTFTPTPLVRQIAKALFGISACTGAAAK